MGRVVLIIVGVISALAGVCFIGCGACANYWDARSPWNVDVNNKRVADEEMLQAHLKRQVPGYPAVKIVGIVLGYGASVGLILASVALFFGKWWAKFVAAPVFALALLHHLIFIVYTLVWVNPAIDSFFAQIPRPAIVNQAADLIIKTQSYSTRVPGYISISWWAVGCLFYVIAIPAVLFTPVAASAAKADKKVGRKSRAPDDEDEEDEDDERESQRRGKKRRD